MRFLYLCNGRLFFNVRLFYRFLGLCNGSFVLYFRSRSRVVNRCRLQLLLDLRGYLHRPGLCDLFPVEQFRNAPALGAGEGPRLRQADHVPNLELVALIVRLELLHVPHGLVVDGMVHAALHDNYHRLVHHVADHAANAALAEGSSFIHSAPPMSSRSRATVRMCARRRFASRNSDVSES